MSQRPTPAGAAACSSWCLEPSVPATLNGTTRPPGVTSSIWSRSIFVVKAAQCAQLDQQPGKLVVGLRVGGRGGNLDSLVVVFRQGAAQGAHVIELPREPLELHPGANNELLVTATTSPARTIADRIMAFS